GVTTGRLPEFDGVALGIVQAREASVWVHLRVDLDANPGGAELRCHRIEIANAKIDHHTLPASPKYVVVSVIRRHDRHAQMIAVPRCKRDRVTREEKQPADAFYIFHASCAQKRSLER